MNAIGGVLQKPFQMLGLVPKPPKLPAPPPPVTRDAAAAAIAADDAMAKRRGGAADIMTGSAGAEAPASATGKATLGS